MIDLSKHRRIHILAAGGVGMSAIAQVLVAKDFSVSGSDREPNKYSIRLGDVGVALYAEDDLTPLRDADLVVRSTAIRDDHPSWVFAQQRRIACCHRSEILAALLNHARGVAVAGTHGKTTTTAMTGMVFEAGGLDPTVLVGGWVDVWHSNVRMGRSSWMVAEADESDGSFTRFEPEIAVVTNIERDHLDYFHTIDNIHSHFREFASHVKPAGAIWAGSNVRTLLEQAVLESRTIYSYGWNDSDDLRLCEFRREGSQWCAGIQSKRWGSSELRLEVAGKFNLENAAVAVACGLTAGLDIDTAARALDAYRGTQRRQQHIAAVHGITIIDDYAHHATEIAVTLEAIRQCYPGRRVVVLFQPHRYTRTRDHAEELAAAFGSADVLCLTALYAASEDPIPGVSAKALAELAKQHHSDVRYVGDLDEAEAYLLGELRTGDVLVTMGAGSVTTMGPRLVELLDSRIGAR